MTDHPETGTQPAPGAWCHWHRGPSSTAVLIDTIGEDPDPVESRYACAPCRQVRGLRPAGEQP